MHLSCFTTLSSFTFKIICALYEIKLRLNEMESRGGQGDLPNCCVGAAVVFNYSLDALFR